MKNSNNLLSLLPAALLVFSLSQAEPPKSEPSPAQPATAQVAQPAGTPASAPAPTPPTGEAGPVQPLFKEPVEAPPIPRSARWQPCEARYFRANVRHPALYYRSVQERLSHDDSPARTLPGLAAAELYELVQFPAQFLMTPCLVAVKPPWRCEYTQP